MQVTVTSQAVRSRALEALRKANNPALKFIELALNGKKIGFEKVIAMIDEMAATLKKEQGDDDAKKEYCETQFDQTEDKIKELDNSVSDSETAIKEMTGAIATLKEETAVAPPKEAPAFVQIRAHSQKGFAAPPPPRRRSTRTPRSPRTTTRADPRGVLQLLHCSSSTTASP